MNVYDFDETIFRRDSTACFYFHCLRRHPGLLRYLPSGAAAFFRHYVLHRGGKTEAKERFYRWFRAVPDMESAVSDFWSRHIGEVHKWYLAVQQPDDVVISASPEFLVRPACALLGVRTCIASHVDPQTGKYDGLNCHGAEKVRRFREAFPDGVIERFYSDSLSDTPLARLASEAFLVSGEKLSPWPKA